MTSHDTQQNTNFGDESFPSVERVLEIAITLPFAIGARFIDAAPAGFEKARQQIVLARFIGKLAVDRGARELRDRLAGETESPSGHGSVAVSNAPAQVDETTKTPNGLELPSAESLALPDYDQLPAAHVIARLASLSQHERNAIERYETMQRHRRTVLGKLTQLRSGGKDV